MFRSSNGMSGKVYAQVSNYFLCERSNLYSVHTCKATQHSHIVILEVYISNLNHALLGMSGVILLNSMTTSFLLLLIRLPLKLKKHKKNKTNKINK